VLEKNARANRHIANIITLLAAAGPEQGFLQFEYSDSGFCNGGRHESISAVHHGHAYTLSVFCVDLAAELQTHYQDELGRLKFIKVDAEGFDLYVLRALTEIIESYRPVVKAEVFKKTDKQYRCDLLELFESRQYAVYEIVEEPLKAGPRLTMDNLMRPVTYDIICLPE
jgi:FkbM family methyltransferase